MLKQIVVRPEELEVGVVEDDLGYQEVLVQKLEKLGCQIVWRVQTDEEARQAAQQHMPAIVLVDLRLRRGSSDYTAGWQLIGDLRGLNRRLAVIILSGTPVIDKIVLEAIRLGCSYVVKHDIEYGDLSLLAGSILAARSRAVLLSNEVAVSVEEAATRRNRNPGGLTDREMEVLELMADGCSNREIADRLVLSVAAVKSHVSNILSKLEVDNRGKAAEWYRQNCG